MHGPKKGVIFALSNKNNDTMNDSNLSSDVIKYDKESLLASIESIREDLKVSRHRLYDSFVDDDSMSETFFMKCLYEANRALSYIQHLVMADNLTINSLASVPKRFRSVSNVAYSQDMIDIYPFFEKVELTLSCFRVVQKK